MIKFEQNVAYRCEKEEIANKLLKELNEQGYKWNSGGNLLRENNYYVNEEKTCYYINEVNGIEFSEYGWYKERHYKIINAKTLLEKSDLEKDFDKMIYNVGDIIENINHERKILAKVGLVYILSAFSDFSEVAKPFTQHELDNLKYKLKTNVEKPKEKIKLTFSDIAKLANCNPEDIEIVE